MVKELRTLTDKKKIVISVGFSLLFSLSLVFLTFDAPSLLNDLLLKWIPDYGHNWLPAASGALNVLRPFGYLAFLISLVLIVTGFVHKKWNLSFLGSLAFYIPVFAVFF